MRAPSRAIRGEIDPNIASKILKLRPESEIKAFLYLAKAAVASSEVDLHRAAKHIACASDRGASQREIASAIGKSAPWVNRLLRWHSSGYRDGTPFGAESRAKRDRARVQAPERPRDPENLDRRREPSRSGKEIAGQKRQLLVEALDRLSSGLISERANAVIVVETLRSEIGMSWESLIVTEENIELSIQN